MPSTMLSNLEGISSVRRIAKRLAVKNEKNSKKSFNIVMYALHGRHLLSLLSVLVNG